MREIQDQLEKLQQQQIDTDALKLRVAMNESAQKELAIACDDVGERSDRQIRGVLYQVENPEFKRNINKMLYFPAQGTYADWLELVKFDRPKRPIDLWEHPFIVELREVLQTRQAGIKDETWNSHQACKKDEALRQILLNWPAGIDMQLEELEIAEWEEGDWNYIGTRLKSNKTKHGIVRMFGLGL